MVEKLYEKRSSPSPSHLHPIPIEQNMRRDVADQNGPIKMKEVKEKV